MKVTLAQINTTPNDFPENFKKITSGIDQAVSDNADIVVFPELTLPGYLVQDLVYSKGFVEKNLDYLNQVVKYSAHSDVTIFVGYIDRNNTGVGKPFKNMAAVIRGGRIIGTYQKHLLPFTDVFEEPRWFESGTDLCVVDVNGTRVGTVICEDSWNDKGQDDYKYRDNPINRYRELGVKFIVSLNSSPYVKDKPALRHGMFTEMTKEGMTFVYVNQIGGQDSLVFDGHSAVYKNGNVLEYLENDVFVGKATYQQQYKTVDTTQPAPYFDFKWKEDHLQMTLLGLRDYIVKSGFKSVVLGSSGGIDSAVVATLAALAIGPENVHCIMMPSIYSSEGSVNDAKELHKRLGCKEYLVPIEHIQLTEHINNCLGFKTLPFIEKYGEYNKVADENLQARMRGQIVMHYSNAMGALALTTGNKTELSVGYFTAFGDAAGGYDPIGDLYKMEVYQIANELNAMFQKELIPQEIIAKAPSAELKPGQTDEASLLPYPILDEICSLYIEEYITTFDEYVTRTKNPTTESEYKRIVRLIHNVEFKRRMAPPCTKLRKIAFGTGRRIPIVKR
jgi:NAD+ synthase (glutamine-hydrolysing)